MHARPVLSTTDRPPDGNSQSKAFPSHKSARREHGTSAAHVGRSCRPISLGRPARQETHRSPEDVNVWGALVAPRPRRRRDRARGRSVGDAAEGEGVHRGGVSLDGLAPAGAGKRGVGGTQREPTAQDQGEESPGRCRAIVPVPNRPPARRPPGSPPGRFRASFDAGAGERGCRCRCRCRYGMCGRNGARQRLWTVASRRVTQAPYFAPWMLPCWRHVSGTVAKARSLVPCLGPRTPCFLPCSDNDAYAVPVSQCYVKNAALACGLLYRPTLGWTEEQHCSPVRPHDHPSNLTKERRPKTVQAAQTAIAR